MELTKKYVGNIVKQALAEDMGPSFEDKTTDVLNLTGSRVEAKIICNEQVMVCGFEFARQTFRAIDQGVEFEAKKSDGDHCEREDVVATVYGAAASILKAERTALNFLQRLSGISTLTGKFVKEIGNSKTKILDTRKTTPLLRQAEKYAVYCGGGTNHRMGLYDAVLLKDNHIKVRGLDDALDDLLNTYSADEIEVEVDTPKQLATAYSKGVSRFLLDNMTPDEVSGVRKKYSGVYLEVSGGITLSSVKAYANTGVDAISVGALTHSAGAIDMSLEIE